MPETLRRQQAPEPDPHRPDPAGVHVRAEARVVNQRQQVEHRVEEEHAFGFAARRRLGGVPGAHQPVLEGAGAVGPRPVGPPVEGQADIPRISPNVSPRPPPGVAAWTHPLRAASSIRGVHSSFTAPRSCTQSRHGARGRGACREWGSGSQILNDRERELRPEAGSEGGRGVSPRPSSAAWAGRPAAARSRPARARCGSPSTPPPSPRPSPAGQWRGARCRGGGAGAGPAARPSSWRRPWRSRRPRGPGPWSAARAAGRR